MKKLVLLIVIISAYTNYAFCQAPLPPHKICFDYDVAGNRIAQKPAWLNPNPVNLPDDEYQPDCQCNDPENTKSTFGNIITIEFWSDLNWVIEVAGERGALINWILPKKSVPSGLYAGDVPKLSPSILGSQYVLVPGGSYGVVVLEDEEFSTERRGEETLVEAAVMPNPNDGKFKVIQLGFDEEQSKIHIFDCKGTPLFDREFVNGSVNIRELPDGTYILVLTDGKHSKTVRFIKR